MANEEHLKILNQGVDFWNRWRMDNPEIKPELSGANLSHIDLIRANLTDVSLRGAKLWATILIDADLLGADLSEAELCAARLLGANLSYTNLENANFQASELVNANFAYANFRNTYFLNATLGGTLFADVDLRQADGLDIIHHYRPSSFDVDTIYLSRGNEVVEDFLRDAGVPDDFLKHIVSFRFGDTDFYRCFISFTESNDALAEKIYGDLKDAGVQCWRWKEDAKWGRALMRSIDEAVRSHDKLIVICSRQSLNSPAVIREIERALQKEDDLARAGKNADVLFPIRIDDYIFTEWNHHRKADLIEKCIGDFSQWQKHEFYGKSLKRLISDLKADKDIAND